VWAARSYWIGNLESLGCTPIFRKHLIRGEHATLPPSRALTEAKEGVSDTRVIVDASDYRERDDREQGHGHDVPGAFFEEVGREATGQDDDDGDGI